MDFDDGFKVTEEQLRILRETFDKFDKKKSGFVSTSDLSMIFRSLHISITPEQLQSWSNDLDVDATGQLSVDGLIEIYTHKLKMDADMRELREAFRALDKKKKGQIDVEDIRWILRSLGNELTEDDIDAMIRSADADGSGAVDFDEFCALMNSD